MIEDWFRGILTDGILSNLSGLFDSVNTEVGEIATQVGTTPAGWNAGIFNMIRSLSENVIVPIAGVIITFVMCYELIQLVIEKNNLHDLDTWIFFKWIFKTFVAVLLVTNTWNIVMGVFEAAQSVVNRASGLIVGNTSINLADHIADLEARLLEMNVWSLLGLWLQSFVVGFTMWALTICIFIIIYGRMIEIYLVTSIAPIPMATMMGKEWGGMGQNYLRSLLALAFQGFLISLLNNASAGEYAAFTVIAADSGFLEMALITLITNARYLLMSCSLSQKFSPDTPLYHRLLVGYDVTDELFGIAIARPGYLDPFYSYGAFLPAIPGWAIGTALGVTAGSILPTRLVSALSVALFGMFLAIIIPPSKKNPVVLGCVAVSFAASWLCTVLPYVKTLSEGTRTILLTILIASAAALLFPVKDAPEQKEGSQDER